MSNKPSLGLRLFGTEQAVPTPRKLKAGPLSAELENGNLRYVRCHGVEVIRAVSFIVRDKDWGTYGAEITDLEVDETGDRFSVRYKARAADAAQAFFYEAQIVGEASGRLVFAAQGTAETDFLTNRTGFVILHPIEGVAGEKVEIVHVDGSVVESRFPSIIDPLQPMMELRQLTHWAAEGALRTTCLMEGDTFEMEDQRNWTDASYKTYVRPLALPWPYTLAKGTTIDQRITVGVDGTVPASVTGKPVHVSVGHELGSLPWLGMGLDPDDTKAAQSASGALRELGPHHLVCHHDPRRGHGRAELEAQVAFARDIGATPWLEAVITSIDGAEVEVAQLGEMVAEMENPFSAVMLSPAPDLKCTLPGSPWPPAPDPVALFTAARTAFPAARVGGGMFSYFTELNRKRPPTETLDFVSFTTSALVHAGDDRSVMETLQALPAIARSAQAIASGQPYAVGPSAIGMRANPYGEAPKENQQNIRQAMNRNDPRQRGLLGAAWALGYFARFSAGGAFAIALGSPVGASGAVYAPADFPQPVFDERGGVFPVYHVLRGLARLGGAPMRQLNISEENQILGIAANAQEGLELWLANLGDQPLELELERPAVSIARLEAGNFLEGLADPTLLDALASANTTQISMAPYGIVRLRLA
ncbi:hypothetical protein [Devosia naphthalenivorans]|uniref:hypothetical protein n=1 Tax=Devosia naphthalenivorans TaxID=2082392 RepID=UPI000D3463B4|nr:hypothetical protein [Devosia naphthalenivorans]